MIRLFRFLKPYKDKIAIAVVLLFLQVMAELYLPTLMSDIVNKGIVNGDTKYIMKIGGFMLLVAAGNSIATILANFFSSKFATAFGRDLRRMVFTKGEGFSLHEFDKIGTPSMITRTTNDITQIQQFVVIMMKFMVTAPIMAVGGFAMALSKDKKLTLVLAVSIPLLIIIIFSVARKAIPLFKAMQNKVDKINLVLRENLTGIRVIRAFNRIDDEKERFKKASYDFTVTAIKVNKMISIIMPMMMLIMNFTSVAIVWFGGIRIDNGNMQVGDMMAFIQYIMQIMFSFLMLAMMFVMIPRAEASADRINEVLDMEPEITDPENPKNECVKTGYVEFKDVTFNYPGSQEPAIKNISFSVKPGETTAIIGGTGSGKSTLINLIPRFYDVTSGAVLVDGIDVRDMSQKELRKK
jgi:ATP-binding cassette, subfamily B, multidrug efflux pump